ncbi:MAG: DUF4838 domain-containing protein [Candidatus Odinarchaeota archaeon]
MVQVNFDSGKWIIKTASKDKVVLKAASELQKYLELITGYEFPLSSNPENRAQVIDLNHQDQEIDGYKISIRPDNVSLSGFNPRGVLYAVFSFLESLGCSWPSHRTEDAVVPSGTLFQFEKEVYEETAFFPGRCLIIGHYIFMKDVEDWISWAARNRLNTIYMHVTVEKPAFGSAPEKQWQQLKDRAVLLAREYGMLIEHGGHGLENFLPRKMFKMVPDAFRYNGKERTRDHNFCPSSTEGLKIIRSNAEKYFLSHPEVDVFHLYAADIPGGGWCECERCREYTPSEQALIAINNVAEPLGAINPFAQVVSIAYHDTEKVPRKVTPRENVSLLWAPRRRCYAHAIDDTECPINSTQFAEIFVSHVAHYRNNSPPPRIFEYYLDAILFKSLLPPLFVMQRDIKFYRKNGAHTVQALMTGDREWMTPQLNNWLFSRLTWNPDQEIKQLVSSFCRAVFKTNDQNLISYYLALEQAFRLALDMVPEQNELRYETDTGKIFDVPPTDMADPYYAPLETLQEKTRTNEKILDLVKTAETCLLAARPAVDPGAWEREQKSFGLTKTWLEFDLNRIKLYTLVAAKADKREIEQAAKNARTSLDEVIKWGKNNIKDKRFRLNFRFMHVVFWQIRLEHILVNEVHGKLKGTLVKAKLLIKIGYQYWRMKRLY